MGDTTPQQFKDVIEKIVDARIENEGITKYVSAVVFSSNEDMTVNVYIPPEKTKIITGLINKTGEPLFDGDSVEICTKNGLLKNAWVAVKHGKTLSGAFVEEYPIGSIVEYGGKSAPDGWMICDGRELDRDEYAQLFEVIKTIYGDGDGKTSFNIPDMRGRVPVGYYRHDDDFGSIGEAGGEKSHKLTIGELPSHEHSMYENNPSTGSGSYITTHTNGSNRVIALSGTTTSTQGYWAKIGQNLTGSDKEHNNLQPYIVVNYIIKVSSKIVSNVVNVGSIVDTLGSSDTNKALSARQGKILDERIDKIIDSDSTSNGNYVRYSDGTMICYGNFSLTNISTNTWGSLYSVEMRDVLTFPKSFKENPVVNVSTLSDGSGWYSGFISNVVVNKTTITLLTLTRPTNMTNGNLRFHYIAIGRWK